MASFWVARSCDFHLLDVVSRRLQKHGSRSLGSIQVNASSLQALCSTLTRSDVSDQKPSIRAQLGLTSSECPQPATMLRI